MKRVLSLIIALLAMNFLLVAGVAGYLIGTGKLDAEKADKIKDVIFAAATQPATQPATMPSDEANGGMGPGEGKPLLKLDELLKKQAGKPATEQIEFIRNAFDEQQGQLDRRIREMQALQQQIETARRQVALDRAALEARQKELAAKESEAVRQEQDTGFQNELALYNAMPAAQVKKVFLAMDDEKVAKYLQAMTPRNASKILKEFKSPEEALRVNAIMEKVRKAPGSGVNGAEPAEPGRASGGLPGGSGPSGNGVVQPNGVDSPVGATAAGQP